MLPLLDSNFDFLEINGSSGNNRDILDVSRLDHHHIVTMNGTGEFEITSLMSTDHLTHNVMRLGKVDKHAGSEHQSSNSLRIWARYEQSAISDQHVSIRHSRRRFRHNVHAGIRIVDSTITERCISIQHFSDGRVLISRTHVGSLPRT